MYLDRAADALVPVTANIDYLRHVVQRFAEVVATPRARIDRQRLRTELNEVRSALDDAAWGGRHLCEELEAIRELREFLPRSARSFTDRVDGRARPRKVRKRSTSNVTARPQRAR